MVMHVCIIMKAFIVQRPAELEEQLRDEEKI